MPYAYLLDTNIVSYFIRGAHPALVNRCMQVLEAQSATISVVTRAELRFGQACLATSDKRRRAIDLVLDQLPALPWTSAAADLYGSIKDQLRREGTPIGDMDTLIAAHALTENLILVTHNTRHFEKIPGLRMEDWMV
ncbi:MAG: VapC toxin family PIN domain ribonuclease [Burkholderiales bacterium PBB4]|nr:MAG: VapC toxin family PIN domain ribonuclease [Burkholderiales bacterium PBB4]